MAKPITPAEAASRKREAIPEGVYEAFNELIAQGFDGTSATVRQDAAADLIASKMDVPRAEVFRRHWLDVEDAYRKAGWDVEYDKPGFNESYEATFTFRKKRQ